jgi:DNA-binding Xre family transcriptional regulator
MGLSKNKIATESNIRPNTISDIVNGKIKRMDLDTLESLIDALNHIAYDRNMDRRFTINDIMIYQSEQNEGEGVYGKL